MDDSTLTIDKLRASSYLLSGFTYKVSEYQPENIILLLPDSMIVVPTNIDEVIREEWDLVKAIERIASERPDVQIIDLRNVRNEFARVMKEKYGH